MSSWMFIQTLLADATIVYIYFLGFKSLEIMYTTMERIKVTSILFADDNLSPTKIERIEQLDPVLRQIHRGEWTQY